MIGGIVLAAGGASRFGSVKQLADLRGRPLIEHAVAAMVAVAAIERIVVVLGAQAERIKAEADLGGVEVLVAEGWEEGVAASLRAGINALADTEAVVVALADQPLITPQVIAAVLGQVACPPPAARATFGGVPGHPTLIKRELFAAVGELSGDVGARDLLADAGAAMIEVGHLCSDHDVDTLKDLEAIRGVPAMEVRN